MDWKQHITFLTDKIINQSAYSTGHKAIGNKIMSNFPLQLAFYINVWFFPIWLTMVSMLLYDKYVCYNLFTRFVIITVISVIIIVEILRLYLGYEGNLQNKIPELAGFWMLSILLQLPLEIFLFLNVHFHLNPLDKIVQAVMCAILTLQLVSGFRSLNYMSKHQTLCNRILNTRRSQNRE